ncbi:MAG TPA: hypothetical protein VK256_13205 [Candidatus Eisenbacteria bacterium]|nr:hypothetical protein [Candidatus Eisenbacteria bacterium]
MGLVLGSEILTLGLSLGSAGWVAVSIANSSSVSGYWVVGALILGFVLAVVLAFVQYAAAGRRSTFLADLRGSLWFTRTGVNRL